MRRYDNRERRISEISTCEAKKERRIPIFAKAIVRSSVKLVMRGIVV